MSKNARKIMAMLPLGLLLFAAPAWATAPGQLDLGVIMTSFQTAAQNYGQVILQPALHLLGGLIVIEVAWGGIKMMIQSEDAFKHLGSLLLKFVWLGLLVWLIRDPGVIKSVVNGFLKLGMAGAHISALYPSDIFSTGVELITNLNRAFNAHAHFYSIFPALMMLLVIGIILLCFSYLAAQFALAYIEYWIYLAFYPLILAFGSTQWTKQYATNTILKPVSFGLRFMVLYFVIGVAMQVGQALEGLVSSISATNITALWSIAGGCIVLLLIAMKAPQIATDLLSNNLTLSAGDGAGAAVVAGGVLAAGASGGMSAMKGVGAAANVAGGAAQVAGAGIQAAQAAGATGVMGTAMGASAAIGKGVADTVKESIQGLGASTAPGRLATRITEAASGTISAGGSGADTAMRPTPAAPSAASVMPAASSSIQSTMQQIQQLDGGGASQPDAPAVPSEEM